MIFKNHVPTRRRPESVSDSGKRCLLELDSAPAACAGGVASAEDIGDDDDDDDDDEDDEVDDDDDDVVDAVIDEDDDDSLEWSSLSMRRSPRRR